MSYRPEKVEKLPFFQIGEGIDKSLTCFKAYDIRGKLGEELNKEIAYRIGCAYGVWLHSSTQLVTTDHDRPQRFGETESRHIVVVGGDVRLTSEELKIALAEGLMDSGINVIDLGLTGTEEIYFATFHLGVAGGIEITASHNPLDYNGMKLVRSGARPISGDTGLKEIRQLAEEMDFPPITQRGTLTRQFHLSDYTRHLLSYINPDRIKPLKLVVNSGNGTAGHVVDALETAFSRLQIPITLIKIHHNPDGNFPKATGQFNFPKLAITAIHFAMLKFSRLTNRKANGIPPS